MQHNLHSPNQRPPLQPGRPFHWFIALLVLVTCRLSSAIADEPKTPVAQAPPNHEVLKHVRGGVFYIAKPLKERYDTVRAKLMSLNAELIADKITAGAAIPQLNLLQDELNQLRKEIEEKKVLVTPLNVHQQEETTLFDLGPEKCLVITTDQIQLQTWEGPQIKCVLVKNVLATGDEKPAAHFKALRVVHKHGRARDIVGRNDAEVEADEQDFLKSADGMKLTKVQRTNREKFVREIADSYASYRKFQGKDIDTLSIEGLTHEQGNRHQTIRTNSVGGGGHLGGDWQRSAKLIVSVPVGCRAVAVRGCRVGLDIHDLKSELVLTSHDSHDRDYAGEFHVRGVQGPIHIDNVPVQLIENVRGDVTLIATEEFGNAGTTHENGMRVAYVPLAGECSIRQIDGDLTAWVGRFNLSIEGVTGVLNVQNEFGNTVFNVVEKLAPKAHRIISQAGEIDVRFTLRPDPSLQILAVTNHGKVITNLPQHLLEGTSFTTSDSSTNSRRNWRGLVSVSKDDKQGFDIWNRMERPSKVLKNANRSSGLDLISRGGTVKVMRQD